MKYVLMYTSRPGLDDAIPAERKEAVYGAVYGWFEKYGSVITDMGAELEAPGTATSVKAGTPGHPIVVDGPFSEAKENIGGFSIIDVPDLDAAIAMVREWPQLDFPGVAVEIRPMVDHSADV